MKVQWVINPIKIGLASNDPLFGVPETLRKLQIDFDIFFWGRTAQAQYFIELLQLYSGKYGGKSSFVREHQLSNPFIRISMNIHRRNINLDIQKEKKNINERGC